MSDMPAIMIAIQKQSNNAKTTDKNNNKKLMTSSLSIMKENFDVLLRLQQ